MSTTITITPDFTVFKRAREAARELTRRMEGLSRAMVQGRQRRAVMVAGLEGRYQVRGGMDPAYASPEALHGLVRDIMQSPAMGLTLRERSLVAAAAIRGWALSHSPEQ